MAPGGRQSVKFLSAVSDFSPHCSCPPSIVSGVHWVLEGQQEAQQVGEEAGEGELNCRQPAESVRKAVLAPFVADMYLCPCATLHGRD